MLILLIIQSIFPPNINIIVHIQLWSKIKTKKIKNSAEPANMQEAPVIVPLG